jgi:hypothetical protein
LLVDDSFGPRDGEPSILADRTMQSIEVVNQDGDAIPLIDWGSQFQDLEMARRQAALLPPHPFAGTDLKVTA